MTILGVGIRMSRVTCHAIGYPECFSVVPCFGQATTLVVIKFWLAYVCYVCPTSYNKLKLITRTRGRGFRVIHHPLPLEELQIATPFVFHSFYIMSKAILVMANSV